MFCAWGMVKKLFRNLTLIRNIIQIMIILLPEDVYRPLTSFVPTTKGGKKFDPEMLIWS
jgi:hypothetical protein